MYIAQEICGNLDKNGNPRKLVTLYAQSGAVLGFARYGYLSREQAFGQLLDRLGLESGPVIWLTAYRPVGRDQVGWVNSSGTVSLTVHQL